MGIRDVEIYLPEDFAEVLRKRKSEKKRTRIFAALDLWRLV